MKIIINVFLITTLFINSVHQNKNKQNIVIIEIYFKQCIFFLYNDNDKLNLLYWFTECKEFSKGKASGPVSPVSHPGSNLYMFPDTVVKTNATLMGLDYTATSTGNIIVQVCHGFYFFYKCQRQKTTKVYLFRLIPSRCKNTYIPDSHQLLLKR